MSTPSDRPTPPENPDQVDYREAGDITEVHSAIQREHVEPTAKVTPIPMWLTAVCGAAMVWAGTYFGIFNGGLSGNVFNEYESSPALLFPPPAGKGAGVVAEAPQSMAQVGKSVYGANCQSCHQPNGQGNAGQVPPLVASEWVKGGEKRLIAVLLKGVVGPITVLGKTGTYAQNMAPWETSLSSKKIAAVASYVRAEWGNGMPEVTEADVELAKKEFAAQKAQWTEPLLLQIPDENFEGAGAAPAAAAAPAKPVATAPAPAIAATTPAPGAAPLPVPAAPTAAAAAPVAAASPEQLALGKTTYMMTCVACHQPTGAGLPMVFPPITKSPYVMGSAERLAAIILKGNAGPFTVDSKPYNNIMVPQEAMLDDTKIAAVMTFVRANFGNTASAVTPELVTAARQKFLDRKTPWTQAELDAWKDGAAPGAATPAPAIPPPAPAPAAPAPAVPAPVVPPPVPVPAPIPPPPNPAPAVPAPPPANPAPAN